MEQQILLGSNVSSFALNRTKYMNESWPKIVSVSMPVSETLKHVCTI